MPRLIVDDRNLVPTPYGPVKRPPKLKARPSTSSGKKKGR